MPAYSGFRQAGMSDGVMPWVLSSAEAAFFESDKLSSIFCQAVFRFLQRQAYLFPELP